MAPIVRGYGRASTERQSASIEQQASVTEDAFKLYKRIKPPLAEAEWGGFFPDEATTRTSKFRERPMGNLVLAATRPGDVIIVSNFDRIFADPVDVCETIELIEARKFQLLILDSDIDLNSNMGQAVFKIFAIFKELEVKEIRRRGKDTARHRIEKGLPHGPYPIGWKGITVRQGVAIRHYPIPHEEHRAFAMRLLSLFQQCEMPVKHFMAEMHRRKMLHPSGRKWTQPAITRWLRAARDNFPLANGSHTPAPIPADAEPIESLGSPD